MNLIMISVSALLAMWSIDFWHLVREREIRRDLLAIRDDLRWSAISQGREKLDPAAAKLDDSLTGCMRNIHCFSLWTILWVMIGRQYREQDYREFIDDVRSSPSISDLYDKFSGVLVSHLRTRHWCAWSVWRIASAVRPAWNVRESFIAVTVTLVGGRGATSVGRHSIPA